MPPCDIEAAWVLCVDPDRAHRELVGESLATEGLETELVGDETAARRVLAEERPSCIVSEFALGENDGIDLLGFVRDTYGRLPFVLFTDEGNEQVASDAVTAGVSEYLRKTPTGQQLDTLVERVDALIASPDTSEEIAEELKDRAMDRAPVGITVANVRLPDEPLVYVNDAFEQLTGYSAAETLGRNCRFLQGANTDPEKVAEMRRAIENDAPTAVELRNYRNDGEEFWNRVEIAPIRTADGEVTHYVGYQTDVSALKEAELKARKRADELEQKRVQLQVLLARIEGVLRDVSEAVIHAQTTADVEQRVCEVLVDTGEYTRAWVGVREPGSESVSVETVAPTDSDARVYPAPDGKAVSTALDEDVVIFDAEQPNRPKFESEGTRQPSERRPPDQEVARWISELSEGALRSDGSMEPERTDTGEGGVAVPLTYRNTTYGVLGIHAAKSHTFDRHEAVVLSTLGRILATAMNALRSQSLLQGEAAIELEFSVGSGESFVNLSSVGDCHLEHVGTVPRGQDSIVPLLFEVSEVPVSDVIAAAKHCGDVDGGTVVRENGTGDGGVIRLSIDDSALVDTLFEHGGTIVDATATEGAGTVTVQLPKDADPRTFVDEFEDRVPGGSLRAYREDERPRQTNQEFVADVNATLTDRQRETLRTAYASGFFEWPRRASGEEIAETMGVSRSTFHQHLRFAERKLLDRFYTQ